MADRAAEGHKARQGPVTPWFKSLAPTAPESGVRLLHMLNHPAAMFTQSARQRVFARTTACPRGPPPAVRVGRDAGVYVVFEPSTRKRLTPGGKTASTTEPVPWRRPERLPDEELRDPEN